MLLGAKNIQKKKYIHYMLYVKINLKNKLFSSKLLFAFSLLGKLNTIDQCLPLHIAWSLNKHVLWRNVNKTKDLLSMWMSHF